MKGSKVVGYKINYLIRGWLLIVIFIFNFLFWFHDYIKIKKIHLLQYKYVPRSTANSTVLPIFLTYSFLSVHFNIGIVISSKISWSKRTLFWWLPPSVSFSLYPMYHGPLPCNYKNIEAPLSSHWSSPVIYCALNFWVCMHISVFTSRTIIIINFVYTIFHVIIHILNISLSLSLSLSLSCFLI